MVGPDHQATAVIRPIPPPIIAPRVVASSGTWAAREVATGGDESQADHGGDVLLNLKGYLREHDGDHAQGHSNPLRTHRRFH